MDGHTGHAVDDVAVRLEVREEPVVVFVAGVRGPQQERSGRVDVVAGRQDEPDVVGVDGALERLRDLELTANCRWTVS